MVFTHNMYDESILIHLIEKLNRGYTNSKWYESTTQRTHTYTSSLNRKSHLENAFGTECEATNYFVNDVVKMKHR